MISDNSETSSHKWLHDLAWHVNKLVRDPAVMEHFRDKMRQWYVNLELNDLEHATWVQQREEHIDKIVSTPRLRDESAGPPDTGWEWREAARSPLEEAQCGWQLIEAAGWTPPEVMRPEPEEYGPLPLSKRPLRIEEKFTLLAAIHDKYCEGVEQIAPWPRMPSSDRESALAMARYTVLCHTHVPGELKSENRHAIEEFLTNVEADVQIAVRTLVPERSHEGTPTPKGEDGAPDIDHWLEETIPLLNTSDSDKWRTATAAAKLRQVKNSALRAQSSKNRAKYRHSQGTCGISAKGLWWRRELGKQHVWYYLPSLSDDFKHKNASPAQPLRATHKKS